jgi:hypothetical protein
LVYKSEIFEKGTIFFGHLYNLPENGDHSLRWKLLSGPLRRETKPKKKSKIRCSCQSILSLDWLLSQLSPVRAVIWPPNPNSAHNERHLLVLTSFIACVLIEFSCSFMTRRIAPLICKCIILYRCYMFRRHFPFYTKI